MAIGRSREIDADGRRWDAMLDPRTERRQRTRNVVQSTLLLGSLLVVVTALGWLLFAAAGLAWTVVLGTLLLTLRPQIPPRLVLALYQAEPLPVTVAPDVHRMVGQLAARAGLHHAPELYYVPSVALNCFCVGHGENSALAVTDGLLRRLTYREVAGVLAHEIGHLRAGDPAVMSLSDAIGRLCQTLALLGLLVVPVAAVLALTGDARLLVICAALVALPLVVTFLQSALSRSREFEADLAAARLTGDPEGLASALEVLERTTGLLWERVLMGRGHVPDPLLLRTHPTTHERARRLRELEPGDSGDGYGDDDYYDA